MTYFDEHFDEREAPAAPTHADQPEDDGAPPDSKQQPKDSPQDLATRESIARIRAAVDEEIRPLVEARLPDEVRRQAVRMAALKWMRHAGLVADPSGAGVAAGAGGTGGTASSIHTSRCTGQHGQHCTATRGTGRASDARLFAFTLGVGDLYTRCGNAKIALEKHLIQLDNTETRGHPAVRAERKAVVVLVQRVIDDADALVEKAKKLRAMTKAVLQASPPPSPAQSEEEQEGEEAADDDSMEEVEEEEVEEGEEEEEEEEEEKGEEQEDGMLEEEEEEEAEQPQMPVWEPEHRLISHRGVPHSALQLRLPGVPLSAVQVEIKDDGESMSSGSCQGDGVLVVHGVKQPTAWQWRVWQQRQQQQRRRQQQQLGAPFGRFEVRL